MKLLIIFFAALLIVQGEDLGGYPVYDDSAEENSAKLSPRQVVPHHLGQAMGIQRHMILTQKILAIRHMQETAPHSVIVPRPELKKQIITQTGGLTLHTAPPQQSGIIDVAPTGGLLVRQQREFPFATAASKGVSVETGAVADNVIITGEEMLAPVVPVAAVGGSAIEVPAVVPGVPFV